MRIAGYQLYKLALSVTDVYMHLVLKASLQCANV